MADCSQKLITVFTPTYNRCKTLSVLYDSLKRQNCRNFIWLIVDDGSTDETKEKVSNWIAEEIIDIKYIWQENQGKSMAHNTGVLNTHTELFTCVDSDDSLSEEAIEKIENYWRQREENDIGILAFRSVTGFSKTLPERQIHTTLRQAYQEYGITGDTMLIFRTDVISKFEFPKFEHEKFVPEAYLYDLTDRTGTLMMLKEVLYFGEYLSDGYTKNMAKLLKRNPKGYLAFINQRLQFDMKFKDKFLDSVRYISMAKVDGENHIIKRAIYPLIAVLAYPFGILLYKRRYEKI